MTCFSLVNWALLALAIDALTYSCFCSESFQLSCTCFLFSLNLLSKVRQLPLYIVITCVAFFLFKLAISWVSGQFEREERDER